jgi:hypothetical protein
MYKPRNVIYFQAQTGRIEFDRPEAPSNYYWYCVSVDYLAKIKIEVDKAPVGSTGFPEYDPEFLVWLASKDWPIWVRP